jgi:signal transduction histidine kinase
MASRVVAWRQPRLESTVRAAARHPAIVISVCLLVYIALDWVSLIEVLPGTGFTLWNPPPAIAVALLACKGLRFAPVLLVADLVSDFAIEGSPAGTIPTVIGAVIVTVGYTGVAAALRRCAHPGLGFPCVADVAWLLLIVGCGTIFIACHVVAVLVLMHALPANLFWVSTRHFFIGDLSGIVGLLPALLTIPQALDRWREVSRATRIVDIGVFALGLGFALSVVFGVAHAEELRFFYLLLPPVFWIGVRHGLAWCAIAILVEQLALISIVAVLDYSTADFLAFQILSLAVSATGLLIGAVVTERQRTERLLRQQQSELSRVAVLNTAGALGAAVVHEISQPLATVATYVYACRRLLATQPANIDLLDQTMASVEAEIRRAGEIIERLRDFLARPQPRWSTIDLAAITRKVINVLADEAKTGGVGIRVDAQRLPLIAADRIQVEQVLVNLFRNAIEAAAEGHHREKFVRIHLRRTDCKVQVEVEDNGRGVSSDIAGRLFEPFATNKRRGMGLGLSLSREIAKAHGGGLWWDREHREGARFVLELPADRLDTA